MILVVLGFIAFVVMQVSCTSNFARRNKCVRGYLDYYTTGTTEERRSKVGALKVGANTSKETTGINPDLLEQIEDTEVVFRHITALCLLDDEEFVKYIFETEYEEEE
jgi:hypothetical protein